LSEISAIVPSIYQKIIKIDGNLTKF